MTTTGAPADEIALPRSAGAHVTAAPDERLVAQLADAAQLVRQDSRAAMAALHELRAEAQRLDREDLAAESAYLQARAALDQGDLPGALALIELARASWLSAGDPVRAARTDLGRMNVLDDMGRHSDAIEVGRTLLVELDLVANEPALVEVSEQVTWIRAAALENLGVSHGYLGLHQEALDAYRQAEETYQAMGLEEDLARVMANRGVELTDTGHSGEAIAVLRQAALAFDELGDRLFAAKCLAYEARAQLMSGDYMACMAATDRAEAFLDGQDTTTEYARTQLVRAETLTSLNLLDAALGLFDALCTQFGAAGLVHDLAEAEHGRAVVQARLKRAKQAERGFRAAEKGFGTVGDAARVALAQIGRSELVDGAGAKKLVDEALGVLRTSGRPGDHGVALLRSSQLATDPRIALQFLDEMLALLNSHGLPQLAWRERYERGRRHVELGRGREAEACFTAARLAVDSLRSTVDCDIDRLPFMAGREQVNEDAIALLLDGDRPSEAYAIAEQTRARTLVERMSGQLQAAAHGSGTTELDELYTSLLRAPGMEARRIYERAQALERNTTTHLMGSPATNPTDHAATASLGLQPIVTYQIIGEEVLAFVREGDEMRVVRNLMSIPELNAVLVRLDAQWRRFDDPGLAARQGTHLLAAVTDLLQRLHIGLIARLDLLDATSLIVVPAGPLANVPFGALHDGTCHLIERMTVTAAPSARAAAHALTRAQRRTERRRLVVGLADEATPKVHEEVDAISVHPDTTVLRDHGATVDAFLAAAPAHDVLHVASHGLHRPDNPLFSAIKFSDRWLTAGEIAGWSLDGQLVILSACSSGRQHGAGDGAELDGLPRALLAAGAGAVVVNLWPVDDAASSSVMARFHDQLATASAPCALRRAQLETMAAHPHPYRWAPSVVIGAPTDREVSP